MGRNSAKLIMTKVWIGKLLHETPTLVFQIHGNNHKHYPFLFTHRLPKDQFVDVSREHSRGRKNGRIRR